MVANTSRGDVETRWQFRRRWLESARAYMTDVHLLDKRDQDEVNWAFTFVEEAGPYEVKAYVEALITKFEVGVVNVGKRLGRKINNLSPESRKRFMVTLLGLMPEQEVYAAYGRAFTISEWAQLTSRVPNMHPIEALATFSALEAQINAAIEQERERQGHRKEAKLTVVRSTVPQGKRNNSRHKGGEQHGGRRRN